MSMRSLVVPPRHVHPKLLRRQPNERTVERLDLLLGMTQEGEVARPLEDRVPPHRKVGTVNLQFKPCSHDSLVLDPHSCRERTEVGRVRGIEPVRMKDGNKARRR